MHSTDGTPETTTRLTTFTAVDSHAHVFVQGLPLAPHRRHTPEYDATLGDYLSLLDKHGVSHGVLVQPSFLGFDNSFLLDALRRERVRLRGIVMLDPSTSAPQLQELDALGVRGVRLNLVGLPVPDLRSHLWTGFLARVRALDWHVEVHREAADLRQCVEPLLLAGCKVVVDHFGRPDSKTRGNDRGFEWLLDQAATGCVWVKLAAAYRNWDEEDGMESIAAAAALLSHFGPERLVWGSDWPNTQHQDRAGFASALQALDRWIADPEARRRILVDTPAALFGFPETP
jgi:predicted TIM-barrel fold metal-dependent hydrolase